MEGWKKIEIEESAVVRLIGDDTSLPCSTFCARCTTRDAATLSPPRFLALGVVAAFVVVGVGGAGVGVAGALLVAVVEAAVGSGAGAARLVN